MGFTALRNVDYWYVVQGSDHVRTGLNNVQMLVSKKILNCKGCG